MSKVVKFGGSSLADAKQFKKVYQIIKEDKERNLLYQVHQEKDLKKIQK